MAKTLQEQIEELNAIYGTGGYVGNIKIDTSAFPPFQGQVVYATATGPVVAAKEEPKSAPTPFRGEERCLIPKVPQGCPVLPYFGDDPKENDKSFKAIKRWLSSNLHSWPECRQTGKQLELRIEGRPMKGDSYGGEFASAFFHCPHCGF
jgi:hypothetical protein